MSRHAPNLFGPTVLRGGHFESILNAIESSHLGDGRPDYAQAGMIWSQKVYADPADTTSDVVAADLFLESGTAGIPIGRFDFVAGKLSLDATAREMFGAAAYLDVGTDVGDVVTVQADGKLPALDASDLTNVPAPAVVPAPNHQRVAKLPFTVGGAGSYRSGGVVMADGSLRVWGNPDNGNLGQGSHYAYNRSFPITPAFPRVYAGAPRKWLRHARENILLMENGEVWSWGQNAYGCLGHGHTSNVFVPTKIAALAGINIVDISLGVSTHHGNTHAMFLADDGRLFASGRNIYGQLGLGDTTTRSTPTQLAKTDWAKIYAVGAQDGRCFGIDSSGDLYSWGRQNIGELGLGVTQSNQLTPQIINAFGGLNVSQISACMDDGVSSGLQYIGFTLALLENGSVYGWGHNFYGQLGLGNNTDHFTVPQHLTALGTDNVEVLAAFGDNGTAYVRKSNGEIWATGYNGWGQIGQGDTTNRNTFTLVPQIAGATNIVQMIQIGTMGGGLAVLYDDGRIGVLGYNGHGQLGVGTNANISVMTEVLLPVSDKPISICAVGNASEAGLGIMTEGGKYYQTGYAGASQLPEDDDEPSSVPYLVQF
jgi:alpha-tubulin suppressor-like RCC1 family protein